MVSSIIDLFSILPNGLLGIVAFGYLATFLGLVTLALGAAAWLFRSGGHSRR